MLTATKSIQQLPVHSVLIIIYSSITQFPCHCFLVFYLTSHKCSMWLLRLSHWSDYGQSVCDVTGLVVWCAGRQWSIILTCLQSIFRQYMLTLLVMTSISLSGACYWAALIDASLNVCEWQLYLTTATATAPTTTSTFTFGSVTDLLWWS